MKTKNLYISFLLAVAFFLICTVTFANPSPKGEPPEIAPVLVTPFNNSTNIEIFPELSWSDVSNAVTYKIKVSKLSDGVIVFETSTQDINYTITDGILEYDREYKWTVCACNEYGNSLWATAFIFKTLAINISGDNKKGKLKMNVRGMPPEEAPVLVTPFNNSANIEIFPELSWTEVSSAVSYNIIVSRLSDGVIVFETNTQDINYTITDGILEYEREYKWTVRACNEYGNSLWATAFVFKTLAINISGEDKNYKLNNNYPNPFNPVTKISFNIPKNTIVKIKIYDMLGREVKVLANNFYNAGMHSVEFNASNLSSGIYIYKMEAGDFKAIKKMMLVK